MSEYRLATVDSNDDREVSIALSSPAIVTAINRVDSDVRVVAIESSSIFLPSPRYEFQQSIAQPSWVIAHNLQHRPIVQTYTVGGIEIVGDIQHQSDYLVIVNFSIAIAGYAILT